MQSLYFRAREPFWLLLVIPNWRIIQSDPHKPIGILFAYFISIGGIFIHTILQGGEQYFILVEYATRVLWFTLIIMILGAYIDFISRIADSKKAGKKIAKEYAKKVFHIHEIPDWGNVILSEVLEMTKADYASFQLSNYYSGSLMFVSALKPQEKEGSFVKIFPDPSWLRLRFVDKNSKGITAYAAREGITISALDVKQNNGIYEYVEAFPDVVTEIAVPIKDHVNNQVGGIINIEYKKENPHRPQSQLMLNTYQETLEQFSNQLGLTFSFVLLSNLRNIIRKIGVEIASAQTEKEVSYCVVEYLHDFYECPLGVWLVGKLEHEQDKLFLNMARELPKEFSEKNSRLSLTKSRLGRLFQSTRPLQLNQLSSKVIDNWDKLGKMLPLPKGFLIIPIRGYTGETIGGMMMMTNEQINMQAHEIELLEDLSIQVALAIGRIRRTFENQKEMLNYTATAAAHDIGSSILHLESLADNLLDTASQQDILEINSKLTRLASEIKSELGYLEDIKGLVNIQLIKDETILQDKYRLVDLINVALSHLESRGVLSSSQVRVFDIPPGAEFVYCNRPIVVGTIKNILRNAANAVRRSQNKAIEIHISSDDQKNLIAIDFHNFGEPISNERRKFIFEPGMSTTGGQGVGLGTYRTLIRKMGGILILQPSSETVFSLRLKKSINDR